jgi:hypothetical protein
MDPNLRLILQMNEICHPEPPELAEGRRVKTTVVVMLRQAQHDSYFGQSLSRRMGMEFFHLLPLVDLDIMGSLLAG